MNDVLEGIDLVLLWTIHIGGALALGLVCIWLLLWICNKLASMIMYRLWTTELTVRVAAHLWNSTTIPPPKGWEPLSDDTIRRAFKGRKIKT